MSGFGSHFLTRSAQILAACCGFRCPVPKPLETAEPKRHLVIWSALGQPVEAGYWFFAVSIELESAKQQWYLAHCHFHLADGTRDQGNAEPLAERPRKAQRAEG